MTSTSPTSAAIRSQTLSVLHQSSTLTTSLHRVCAIAGQLLQPHLQTPLAFVALLDTNNIWLTGPMWNEPQFLPRCALPWETLFLQKTPCNLQNASQLIDFKHFPLTFQPAFFASVPVHAADAQVLGSLCLVDKHPHPFEDAAMQSLTALAQMVEHSLACATQAMSDHEKLKQFEDFYDHSPCPVAWISATGHWTRVNPALAQLLGCSADAVSGQPVMSSLASSSHTTWLQFLNSDLHTEQQISLQLLHAGGQAVDYRWHRSPLRDTTTQAAYFLAMLHEITPEAHYSAVAHPPRFFDLVVRNIPALVAYVDRNLSYQFCNYAYEEWFGLMPEQVVGKKVPEVLDELAFARAELHIQKALRGLQTDFENEILTIKGYRYVKTRYIPDIVSQGVVGFYALVFDITEQKALEDQLSYEATHDPLTSLPNRRAFTSMLRTALSRRQRADRGLALMYIDLDEFKNVNTAFNREYGDMVLQYIARFLLTQVRQTDMVARWGGDEFIITLEGLANPHQDAVHVAEKIIKTLNSPQMVGKKTCLVQCSIGIAIAEKDQQVMADELLARADNAMYRAKNRPQERYAFE